MASIATGLLMVLALAGCATSTSAASASSLIRPRPTTALETYTLQKNGAATGLSDALDQLAALLASPRYLDEAWKSNAVSLATAVELGYRQLEGLSPPGQDQEQHAAIVRAVQDCQTLTVYVFQGINNLDKGPFDEVTKRVHSCRNALRLATGAPASIEDQIRPVGVATAGNEVHAQAKRDANLRGGAGTNYPVVGVASQGDKFTIIGRSAKGDWLQVNGDIASGWWIAVFLVQPDGDLQTVPVVTPAAPPPGAQPVVVTPTPNP